MKRNQRGLIVPTYSDLYDRMLHAVRRLEPTHAAVVGMHFERWHQRQPNARWCRSPEYLENVHARICQESEVTA